MDLLKTLAITLLIGGLTFGINGHSKADLNDMDEAAACHAEQVAHSSDIWGNISSDFPEAEYVYVPFSITQIIVNEWPEFTEEDLQTYGVTYAMVVYHPDYMGDGDIAHVFLLNDKSCLVYYDTTPIPLLKAMRVFG